jgi:hypothetical protein
MSTWSVPLACPAASKEPLIVPLPLADSPLTVNAPPQCLVESRGHVSENEIPRFGTIPLPADVWHTKMTAKVRFVRLFRSGATSKLIDFPWEV